VVLWRHILQTAGSKRASSPPRPERRGWAAQGARAARLYALLHITQAPRRRSWGQGGIAAGGRAGAPGAGESAARTRARSCSARCRPRCTCRTAPGSACTAPHRSPSPTRRSGPCAASPSCARSARVARSEGVRGGIGSGRAERREHVGEVVKRRAATAEQLRPGRLAAARRRARALDVRRSYALQCHPVQPALCKTSLCKTHPVQALGRARRHGGGHGPWMSGPPARRLCSPRAAWAPGPGAHRGGSASTSAHCSLVRRSRILSMISCFSSAMAVRPLPT
jgi:hypothetical protein